MRIAARALSPERILLEFADDGRGMSAEDARRVFEPFFTTRRGRGGTGLGLHIVHNLVCEKLGGSIRLHSAPGQGSRFEIELPTRAPEG
jgi:signal transduction histidine kinase